MKIANCGWCIDKFSERSAIQSFVKSKYKLEQEIEK